MREKYIVWIRAVILTAVMTVITLAAAPGIGCGAALPAEEKLLVTVLDTGQGLAVFCESGGHTLLYDGGGRDSSARVVSFLRDRGAQTLDYAVVSHYDDDHLAGVIGALHVLGCGLVLAPDYIGSTVIYSSFRSLVEEKNLPCEAPAVGNVYPLGRALVETLGPADFTAELENDRCIALRISCAGHAVLLCGDAQEEEELAIADGWMRTDSDVYVVNHHGGASSSTARFLNSISPDYAVISCGRGNDYGHPSAAVLGRLKERGIALYRTDLQGDISFQIDADGVHFDQEPAQDYTPGAPPGEEMEEGCEDGPAYVCNFKSWIFHRPDCETVAKMGKKNKIETDADREELILLGYRPCGICRP